MRSWVAGHWVRVAAAAVLAGAVTGLAWATGGGFWTVGRAGSYYGYNLTATRVILFVVLAVMFYTAPTVVRSATREGRIVFGAWTLYLGAWLVAFWPGIVMTDTHAAVGAARLGVVREWFSWVHAVVNIAAFDLVPQVWALGIIQVLATALTLAFATQALLDWRRSIPAAVVMNVVAALSVPVFVNAVMITRDALFAVGHVTLAIAVAQVVTGCRPGNPARIGWIAVLTAVLSVYRGDGVILLLVVPLLLLAGRPSRAAVLRGGLAFAVAAFAFQVGIPRLLHVQDETDSYQVSLRINPLGAVLNSDFYSRDRAHDLQQLARVVDVDAVRTMYDPAEIPAFWADKWNPGASEADFDAFVSTSNRLLLENAGTVVAGRTATLSAATGLNRGQFTTPPLAYEHRFDFVGVPTGIRTDAPSRRLYDAAADFVGRTTQYTGAVSIHSAVFWNFLPWLALLTVSLFFWRRIPFVAVVSIVILCRVPLVFLFAPAAQFKYYLSVVLGGIVVLGLLLALLRREHLERLRASLRPSREQEPARA